MRSKCRLKAPGIQIELQQIELVLVGILKTLSRFLEI